MKQIKDKNGLTEEAFLSQYNIDKYEKPSVTVDMLLLTVGDKENTDIRKLPEKELRVLLAKRAEHPSIGKWALPGGFVGIHEGLKEAAYRKVKDEINVEDIYLEQLYTLGEDQEEVKRDPRTRVISTSYMALVDQSKLKPLAAHTVDEVKWFNVKKIPLSTIKNDEGGLERFELSLVSEDNTVRMSYLIEDKYIVKSPYPIKTTTYTIKNSEGESLAFDHYKIIDKGIERLKNKIEYTPLAFTLLPEYFTLSELQKVYEVILDKKLLKANFRRKIAPMVKKTEIMQKSGHRPASYFTFNEEWQHSFFD